MMGLGQMMQGGDIQLDEQPIAPTPTREVPVDIPESKIDAETVAKEEKEYQSDVQYKLTDEQKTEIAEYIVKIVDDCVASRTAWQEIRNDCLNLLNGVRPSKSDPWPNCSNISVMAVPTHAKLMHSKLFPAVYNENLIYWRPTEKGDVNNVEQICKLMRYVIKQDMKLQNTVDDGTWLCVVDGTIAFKLRWETKYRKVAKKNVEGKLEYNDVARQKCVVDIVNIDDVYLPQLWINEDDSEYIGHNMYVRLPDIDDFIKRKIYIADQRGKIDANIDEIVGESMKAKNMEIEGTTPAYNAHKNSTPIRLIEMYMPWEINGELRESVFTIAYNSKAYLSGKPLEAVSSIGTRPWVIGQFIRRPGSPYGISLIEVMRGLAKELDAIHNQRIDAGSIAIAPFGFYRAASSFKPDKIQIGPGVMIPVDDIKDVNVIQLQHNPVASFQEERIIIEYIEKLTSTSAYQMGRESDIVKSRATATATMAIMGQGEQAFTILGIRLQEIFSRLLTKILQQYQMFMPPGYADRILGEDVGALLFPSGLSTEDIAGQYDAYMTLDPTNVNKAAERQANAALVQMAPQLLAMAQDPRGYEIASEFLKSIGKVEIEKYLGSKPVKNPGQTGGLGAFGQAAAAAQGGGAPMGPGMGNVMPQGGGEMEQGGGNVPV